MGIDWQQLYASNRAAIAAGGGPALPAAPPLPAGLAAPGLPAGLAAPPLPAGPAAPALPALPPLPARRPGLPLRRSPAGPRPRAGDHRTFTVAGRPRRALVHAPAGVAPGTALPLVCMLHGCTQDAAGFAAATAMSEAADRHGFVVVYPEQERGDNPQGCWNWFRPEHQRRDGGEPEALAAIVREVAATSGPWRVDERRIYVAGLSSGGAMALVLALTHPDLFAAVAVHSGLAYGTARDVASAFAAMAGGAEPAGNPGERALRAMGGHARPVPGIVLHGTVDRTVAPENGRRVLEQLVAVNRLADPELAGLDAGQPAEVLREPGHGVGHACARSRWTDRRGRVLLELVTVDGLGHAWSGGAAGGSYTDPRGPSATDAIWSFFAEVSRR